MPPLAAGIPLARTHSTPPPARRVLPSVCALLLLACLLVPGCAGHGWFEVISTQMNDLSQTRPLKSRIDADECYYSLDEQGRITLVMRYARSSWLGPIGKVVVTLSFCLDEPPAGRARTYPLRLAGMRGHAAEGVYIHRLRSVWGIAVVWDKRERSLRCKFRLRAMHQRGNVLTGWSKTHPLFMIGELLAVENPHKVRELLGESEVDDWARPQEQPDQQPPAKKADEQHTANRKQQPSAREQPGATLIGTPWVSEPNEKQ